MLFTCKTLFLYLLTHLLYRLTLGLTLSATVPGCLVTASSDKTVKVWDYSDGKPGFVMSKEMKMV